MRRAALRAALCVALAGAAATSSHAASLFEFKSRLRAAAQAASELRRAAENPGTAEDPEVLKGRIRTLIPEREAVETDEGHFEVDNSWVGERLRAYEAARTSEERAEIAGNISGRLSALRDHVDAYAGSHGATAGERAKLREILARPEFRDPGQDPLARLIKQVKEYIVNFFVWIRDKLFGSGQGSAFAAGVRALVIVLGCVAAVLLLRALWRLLVRRDPEREFADRTILGERVAAHETAATLAESARALAAAGDFRGAVRKLYVAELYALAERGLLALSEETTNREYLAQVRSLAALHPVLSSMTDMFERVWFGGFPATSADFDDFSRMYERALQAAPAARAEA
jgi:hypothetical protein